MPPQIQPKSGCSPCIWRMGTYLALATQLPYYPVSGVICRAPGRKNSTGFDPPPEKNTRKELPVRRFGAVLWPPRQKRGAALVPIWFVWAIGPAGSSCLRSTRQGTTRKAKDDLDDIDLSDPDTALNLQAILQTIVTRAAEAGVPPIDV
jgi:hypothetical protein